MALFLGGIRFSRHLSLCLFLRCCLALPGARESAEALPRGAPDRVHEPRQRSKGSNYQINQSKIALEQAAFGARREPGDTDAGRFFAHSVYGLHPLRRFARSMVCWCGRLLLLYFLILMAPDPERTDGVDMPGTFIVMGSCGSWSSRLRSTSGMVVGLMR